MRSTIASLFVRFVTVCCVVVSPVFVGVGGAILGMRLVSSLVIWRDGSFAGVVFWINVGRGNGVERYVSVIFSFVLVSSYSGVVLPYSSSLWIVVSSSISLLSSLLLKQRVPLLILSSPRWMA